MKEMFRSVFDADYQGYSVFLDKVLKPLFGDALDVLPVAEENPTNVSEEAMERAHIKRIVRVANIAATFDRDTMEVFDITLEDNVNIARSRVGIQQLIRRGLFIHSHAFMIFHAEHPEGENWRFSYARKLATVGSMTDAKRYTYLFGRNMHCRTAIERFAELAKGEITDQKLQEAFNVEALSDAFFKEYKEKYAAFVKYITGKYFEKEGGKWVEKSGTPNVELMAQFRGDDKAVRDYVKKMMGRITFLHFLQKKGWMNGDVNFMQHLFESSNQKANYLEAVLEPLFFGILNTKPQNRSQLFKDRNWDLSLLRQWESFPYLNGGLFEEDDDDRLNVVFPENYFVDLFDFYSRFNFTVDENDPDDAEVGVDPEMLGKIFENLLEDNKDKGAFYTPKEIVRYMCQESLTAYLVGKTGCEEEKIREFVVHPYDEVENFTNHQQNQIYNALESVKICDPAIGSGAFPMGLLNELVHCEEALLGEREEEHQGRAGLKKYIIQNNIYGVDIEKGAIDIARLRFWLSIVVDEETPSPLPNLDYKIMQGNSLLESYKKVDLSHLLIEEGVGEELQGGLFSDLDIIQDTREELSAYLEAYFNCSDHEEKLRIQQDIRTAIDVQLSARNLKVDFGDLNIAANQEFFLWHTWFSDVFKRPSDCEKGFDIVIGNPPYGATLSSEIKDIYKKLFQDVHMRTPDTFNYFISYGIRLLHTGGVLSYIVPNTLLSQNEYIKARRFLYEMNTLNEVVNIGENVFKEADVPTCIIRVRKGLLANYSIRYADYKDVPNESIIWGNGFINIPASTLEDIPGHIIGVEQSGSEILRKIKDLSITIDDIAYEMAAGISTGCNKAFCVNEDTISQLGIERGVLMPLLKGENIDRYYIAWDNEYIIYTTKETDITLYPKAKEFVSAYKEKLDKRSETKKGMIPWWALNRPRYRALFEGEKIIMRQTSDSIRAVFDEQNYFPLNSILTLRLKEDCPYSYFFVLGVLNSSVTNYVYQSISQEKGRAFAEVKPINVRKLYVPKADKGLQEQIELIVRQILSNQITRESGMQIIDNLLFAFYQLSPEDLV